jgi:hypothetical protein
MTNQEILSEFLSLPADAQSQVVSLITFLKQKYAYAEPLSPSSNVDLGNDPFVGMWCDQAMEENARVIRKFCEELGIDVPF